MWIFEILAPNRILTATDRFRESFNTFRKIHPHITNILRDFVEFRLNNPPHQVHSPKDNSFTDVLRGFRHFHMIHGRVILIYKITHRELSLCYVTDHSYSKPRARDRLDKLLRSPSLVYSPLVSDG